jgi:hypothetical protein
MKVKETIKSQYNAALEMLKQAVEACPESLWSDPQYESPFWHVAYHALFFAHLYLQPHEKDFVPWEKHQKRFVSLASDIDEGERGEWYGKEDVLAYLALCRQQVEEQVAALDLEAESGFHWLPFDKLELQFYNIRHIQQHTGELYERLGAAGGPELHWVGMKRD